ncbi:MAG: hypothetical protein ACLQLC_12965 [Candidatus Sulfotelmatobacter sp.]
MFCEGDVVVLKKPLPGTQVPVGTEGTVFRVFGFATPPAYDVDFYDQNHKGLELCRVFGNEHLDLKTSIMDELGGLK